MCLLSFLTSPKKSFLLFRIKIDTSFAYQRGEERRGNKKGREVKLCIGKIIK